MKKIVVAIVMASMLACPRGGFNRPAGAETAGNASLSAYLPPDSLAFFRFNRSLVDVEDYAQSLAHQIMLDDDVHALKIKKRWDWQIGEQSDGLSPQFNIDDIMGIFDREIAVAVIDAGFPTGKPLVRALAAADIRGRREKLEQLIEALRLRIVSALTRVTWGPDPSEPGIIRVQYRGVTVFYTLTDSHLLLASDRETLEWGRKALEKEPDKSLAASKAFREAVSRVGEGSSTLAFVNLREFLSRVAPATVGGRAVFDVFLSNFPSTWAVSSRFDPPGVVTTSFLSTGPGDPSRAAIRSFDNESLRIVPSDSPFCGGAVLDAGALYEKVRGVAGTLVPSPEQASEESPGSRMPNPADLLLAAASARAGFDIRADLLSALKGDLVIYQSPTSGLLLPDYVIAVPVKNPEKIERCIETIALTLDSVSVRETRYNEAPVKAITLRAGEGKGYAFSFFCTLRDGLLLLSSSAPSLKDAVHHIVARKPSVIDTADFITVTAHLPPEKQFISYRKPGKSAEKLYSAVINLLDIVSTSGVNIIDTLELPRKGAFSEKFFGSASACVRRDNGFLCVDYSPLGISVGPVLDNGQGLAAAGMLAAIAVPNFIRGRNTAQFNACLNNIRKFEAAKKMYAAEFELADGNTFPLPALDNYLVKSASAMKCPSGGTYDNLTTVGAAVKCSKHGELPESP